MLAEYDRTVHAEHNDEKIVRYDSAGKWYIEFDPPRLRPARRVTIREAVQRAIELEQNGGTIYLGKPGGGSFDRYVRTERG